ncbi:hypothetical protein M431DRAFT_346917 [Trichoderma harzianum CBS 226.95]|uniref:Uncharacterized protein n=1 Tax=Trichoderma harzianum CBS 226.95 TaxID=983964 RepID=A0A2T4AKR7_TRIHA|nr:hypothetical protein M431DRAFT_346917 [Trichoderma harzianum CBS 226.95]PTB57659.1 hypothetical protein M431DRAFT_346917 [Trichoderma harzianum CBS 226.95]
METNSNDQSKGEKGGRVSAYKPTHGSCCLTRVSGRRQQLGATERRRHEDERIRLDRAAKRASAGFWSLSTRWTWLGLV